MRKLITYGLLFVLVIFLTACNATADAIVDYNNDYIITDYGADEEELLKLTSEYGELVNGSADLAELEAFVTDELMPKSQELLDKVKNGQFDNEEVQDMHDVLIESEELRHQAIELELEAIKSDSKEQFIEASEIMDKADDKKQQFIDKLDELADEYNLEEEE